MNIRSSQLILLFFIIELVVSAKLNAQGIQLVHYRKKDKVLLRWAPESPVSWKLNMKNGYTIERFTVIRDSTRLFPAPVKVVSKSIKPDVLENWEDAYLEDRNAAIAAQAIYGSSFLIEFESGEDSPIQAIQSAEDLQSRYSYLLLVCEESFDVAVMSGLGIEDKQIADNEAYLYKIYANGGTDISDTAFVYVPQSLSPPLPIVADLEAKLSAGKVELSWSSLHLNNIYSTYEIESSTDSINYNKHESVSSIETYNDAQNSLSKMLRVLPLEDKQDKVYYRIRGINSFGLKGPYSNVVSVTPVSQIGFEANLVVQRISPTKISFKLNSNIEKNSDSRALMKIKASLLRSANAKTYKQLHKYENIPDEMVDTIPLGSAYYKVILTSDFGLNYETYPILVQLPDSIPPEVPTGVSAILDTLGYVHLAWNENNEQDFNGYRVFRSRVADSDYRQLTVGAVKDNAFIDTIGLAVPSTKYYYKIQAEDTRYNRSELSNVVGVSTIDTIAPVQPRILGYEVIDSVVSLQWYPSTSLDVELTYLFRKTKAAEDTLLISKENVLAPQEFLDTIKYTGDISYYLKTVDRFNNWSEKSNEVLLSLRNGKQEELRVDVEVNRVEGYVKLSWGKVDNQQIVNIYRRVDNSDLENHKVLASNAFFIKDYAVKADRKYTYLIIINEAKGLKNKSIIEVKY